MESDKSSGAACRRCSVCGISWPTQFKKCYNCGGTTDLCRTNDGPTLTTEEAESKKNHFEFAEWLEKEGRE